MVNTLISVINNFMYLFEGFLGIGLLIGIAGIGIISYRNVIERRQQIGMLRAIGYKRRMIAWSFLIETSFITLLAIAIGVILGVATGWQMYNETAADTGAAFDVPKTELIIISLIAYGATLIFTFYPAVKAAKIPPSSGPVNRELGTRAAPQWRENSAASIAARSSSSSVSAAARTELRVFVTDRAPGITITLSPCARTHASTASWGLAPCFLAIGARAGWSPSFLFSRPPPTGL